MKQLLIMFLAVILFACNNEESTESTRSDSITMPERDNTMNMDTGMHMSDTMHMNDTMQRRN